MTCIFSRKAGLPDDGSPAFLFSWGNGILAAAWSPGKYLALNNDAYLCKRSQGWLGR